MAETVPFHHVADLPASLAYAGISAAAPAAALLIERLLAFLARLD